MILEILLVVVIALILGTLSVIGWAIGAYNTMVTAYQDVIGMIGNMKTEYQRRADFFMNLVSIIKGNAKFEKETMTEVIKMRNISAGMQNTKDIKKTLEGMKGIDGAIGRLLVTVERYPKLEANKSFQKGMDEIRITEDRINVARTEYNNIVNDFNQYIKVFPNNIIANMFRFVAQPYYENDPATNAAPKLDFSV